MLFLGATRRRRRIFILRRQPRPHTIFNHVNSAIHAHHHRQSNLPEKIHSGESNLPIFTSYYLAHLALCTFPHNDGEELQLGSSPANVLHGEMFLPATIRLPNPLRVPNKDPGKFPLQRLQLRQHVPVQGIHVDTVLV